MELEDLIKELKDLKWDLHNNSWYDLEDEIRIMGSIDKAILVLRGKIEV